MASTHGGSRGRSGRPVSGPLQGGGALGEAGEEALKDSYRPGEVRSKVVPLIVVVAVTEAAVVGHEGADHFQSPVNADKVGAVVLASVGQIEDGCK